MDERAVTSMVGSRIDVKQNPVRVPNDSMGALLLAICVLLPIGLWNRYIFFESNLPLFLMIMIIAALVYKADKLYRKGMMLYSFTFFLFIVYAWARLDDVTAFQLSLPDAPEVKAGLSFVFDSIIFYLLFVVAALLYYKRPHFSAFLWFATCGYIIAFIVRNYDIPALQAGYHLSAGLAVITLLPFIYLKNSGDKTVLAANAVLMLCAVWFAVIGARTALASLLLFYAAIGLWPIITRNRWTYYSTFWGTLFTIALLTILYLRFAHLDNAVIPDTGFHIFDKRLGTRTEIWTHLSCLISQNPVFGYGADHATALQSPLPFLEFTYNRSDLSSHSTYFEILFRLGIFGLLTFILLMFSIWRLFWDGRRQWAVRVAGASLLSSLFFASTCEFLVFSGTQLRCGFVWVILGIGAGASLRAAAKNRQSCHQRQCPN